MTMIIQKENKEEYLFLKKLVMPHVDSFDAFLDEGFARIIKDTQPAEFKLDDGSLVKLYIEDAEIAFPSYPDDTQALMYPSDCRIRALTYNARLLIRLGWSINGVHKETIARELTRIPVMVQSKRCNIRSMGRQNLIKYREEPNEVGGYFICSGIERIIRILIVQRRNYPLAMSRTTWKNKANNLTEFGVSIRSVDDCNNIVTNILHYCYDSTMQLSISYQKRQYYIPFFLVLRLLVDYSDYKLFYHVTRSGIDTTLWRDSAKYMLSILNDLNVHNVKEARTYVGSAFRVKLGIPEWYSDYEAGSFLVNRCICIHLDSDVDKLNILVHMAHKLMALVDNKIAVESSDTLTNQEVLLPGQVYQIVLQDAIQSWLESVRQSVASNLKYNKAKTTLSSSHFVTAISKCSDVGGKIEYFLKSGNIKSKNGLGLPQSTGLCIVADKINFIRFISHFRSIHRGVYFSHAYSTKVRKLLPECWGFLCPVHTPDGSPCGLLNHLTQHCSIVTAKSNISPYMDVICSFGLIPEIENFSNREFTLIQFDGRLLGYVFSSFCQNLVLLLKKIKIESFDSIEIIYIENQEENITMPGIYIFSTPCRFIRPVNNLSYETVEMIGTFEQVFTDIALNPLDIKTGVSSHVEIHPCNILSVTAALTPFSDSNQSPRNMYQCQMMKQSMGVPVTSFKYHFDNKLYRLITPQSPICRNSAYDDLSLDDLPIGLNAVLAVISYTGYDMEDAMILNKGTVDRGFASACVYKSTLVDLVAETGKSRDRILVFGCKQSEKCYIDRMVDIDGLPFIGRLMQPDEPFYSYYDYNSQEYSVKRYKSTECAYIDDVAVVESKAEGIVKINIRLRIPRNPVVGDKFSSRHGQKGILSILWPTEDMPFTESGIIPDIIFNPHGFPSRMTIGMMIENMAAKVGALKGMYIKGDPFQPQADSYIEIFGEMLQKAGYNFYSSEKMYSGINGQEIEANIFTGIVYYQRLRHMVSDKYQVRATGPVDPLTRQPVHGRKKGGGIRFGEMERDCLISQGCSYLLQDRLFDCSDKSLCFVCEQCGDLLATKLDPERSFNPLVEFKPPSVIENKNAFQYTCLLCNSSAHIKAIHLPYSFRYLLVELASMNIRVKLKI